MTESAFVVRPALPGESASIRALLAESRLTLAGVGDPPCALWVAASGGEVVGVAGLEQYGDAALLRSVATRPEWRGRGVGSALSRRVLDAAAAAGVIRLYLLTETAEAFFRRLGFETVPRAAADPRLAASAELQDGHCASAVLMARSVP